MRRAQTAIAVIIFLAVAPVAHAACPDFAAAVHYSAGSAPKSVAAGDFNGDGRPDLAVASSTSSSVSILLGNADGTFAAAGPSYGTGGAGGSPASIAAGDFDGDGKLDLAVANFSSNTVAILRGNGLGGLGTATTYATGSGPMFVAVADFDRNGVLDLAVANASSNNVSILIGNGSGGFGTATNLSVGTYPQSIAIGDFNVDGKLDLAVANHNSDNVSVLLGNGSGSFGIAVSFSIPATAPALTAGPTSVTTADFNGDGSLDLAVANDTSRTVAIRLGNGAGSFGTATTFAVGVDPHAVVTGDFNGDGRVDLAVANYSSNTVSILVGSGSGTFTAAIVSHATSTHPTALAIADFNGDGKPDLASANDNGNNVSILLNSGACFVNCATFGAATNFGSNFGGSMGGTSVAAGDFDRDAAPDLAVVSGSHVSVLLGSGTGSFGPPTDYPLGSTPVGVAIADFNGDGKLDLAVAINANFASVSFMLGDGIGGFGPVTSVAIPPTENGAQSLAIGDFNRDGRPDVAVTCGVSQGVGILLNTTAAGAGTPSFTSSAISSVSSFQQGLATGDFNRDGKLDLAIAIYGDGTNPGSVVILLGNGSGGFTSGATPTAGIGPQDVAIGDFNRDGKLDLAVSNSVSNNLSILLGDGAGAFAANPTLATGTNPSAIAVGDFDNDGKLDLLVTNDINLSMLRGDGSGGFTAASPATYTAGSAPLSVAAADLNRDGKLDFAVANSNPNANVSVLLNSCPGADLTVTKNHSGCFSQGSTCGYTIFVNNIAAISTSGTVTLVDTLPAGLTATDISGTGWTCLLGTLTCRRSDPLSGNSSYPAIGISVNVASNAPPSITNTATVSGGSEANIANDTGSDTTTVTQFPDITLTKSHTGNFSQGQTGAVYTITVTNIGGAPSSGPVTMTDTLPAGLTATAISGTGWTCTLGTRSCTRSNALASGASYPTITLTVNVANNAASTVTNNASVVGGSQFYTANDSVSDSTTITQFPDLTVTKTHAGSFTQNQTGRIYSIVVSNSGYATTSGTVSVTDTLPTGLTATLIRGNGWGCTLGTLACTRSDALAVSSSYPVITLTVNVANNAPASVTNTATVSGGGENITANNTASDLTTVNPGQPYCGTFAPGWSSRAGYSPRALASGDFNGDGKLDLAVANYATQQGVSILLGFGNASFTSGPSYSVGNNPDSVATGDFNGDGKLDLAVTSQVAFGVAILLGNGDGTFAVPVYYLFGSGFSSVAIGDFNGDGKLDLVVANESGGNVSILKGNGNGTFGVAVNFAAGPNPRSVAIGDFNSDGNPDLAVANADNLLVAILLGNGDGTFAAPVNSLAGQGPIFMAMGDFNGDGKVDLAVVNLLAGSVSILLGNGDGTFAAAVHYSVGTSPQSVAIEDFNGDGKQDLAVANAPGSASVLMGRGDGTFAAAVSYSVGSDLSFVVAGDFNGDGKPDLAVADNVPGFSGNVRVLLAACADLTITKSHTGSFTQGQTNASYTLTVNNAGPVTTSGTISVTDNLPPGLTATAIGGTGWTCTLGTLICTRSDALPATVSDPAITVTVSVNSNAAASITNSASVSGGGDLNAANNSASDPTTVNPSGLIAPTRLVATATSTSQIGVVWDPVTTAVSYQLYRSSNNGPFGLVGTPLGATFADSGLTGSTTYLYRVQAVNAASAVSPPGNVDLATTIIFTDDPIVAGTTVIKAVHLTQLRTAVDAVRAAAGLANATYTNAISAGASIKAADVTELRSNLNPARSTLALTPMVYVDPSLTVGMTVKAVHVQEIRTGVK